MAKVTKITGPEGTEYRQFICPGCKRAVMLPVTGPKAWGFDGNDDSPTFNPSILQTFKSYDRSMKNVCHSFVRSGRIEFLSDSTHALAGQTIELDEVKEN